MRDALGRGFNADRDALAAYQYVAPKLSLLERVFLERFWTWVASNYPNWLAPNLITLVGAVCSTVPVLLTVWYSPSLDGTAPRWVYLANAALFFAYQTLDGSDGKQARRTKSGSPLGELMDHGCDAWTTSAVALFMCDCFATGTRSLWTWFMLLAGQFGFFTSNLTLLHCGKMKVQSIDVMELQFTMQVCLLISYHYGPAVWVQPIAALANPFAVPLLGIDWTKGLVPIDLPIKLFCMIGIASSGLNCARDILEIYGPARKAATAARQKGAPGMGLRAAAAQAATCVLFLALNIYLALRLGVLGGVLDAGALKLDVGTTRHPIRSDPAFLYASQKLTPQLATERAMLLLMYTSASAFSELMTQLLLLRIAHRRIPALSAGLLCMLAFHLAIERGSLSGCALASVLSAVLHGRLFSRSVVDVANALGIRVFVVKGARSWCSL